MAPAPTVPIRACLTSVASWPATALPCWPSICAAWARRLPLPSPWATSSNGTCWAPWTSCAPARCPIPGWAVHASSGAGALYGIDFQGIRPVDVVARIAPRPLFFIHGAADTLIPPSNSRALAAAARGPHSDVQVWLIPDTAHAQCFSIERREYVRRVIAFYRG